MLIAKSLFLCAQVPIDIVFGQRNLWSVIVWLIFLINKKKNVVDFYHLKVCKIKLWKFPTHYYKNWFLIVGRTIDKLHCRQKKNEILHFTNIKKTFHLTLLLFLRTCAGWIIIIFMSLHRLWMLYMAIINYLCTYKWPAFYNSLSHFVVSRNHQRLLLINSFQSTFFTFYNTMCFTAH